MIKHRSTEFWGKLFYEKHLNLFTEFQLTPVCVYQSSHFEDLVIIAEKNLSENSLVTALWLQELHFSKENYILHEIADDFSDQLSDLPPSVTPQKSATPTATPRRTRLQQDEQNEQNEQEVGLNCGL